MKLSLISILAVTVLLGACSQATTASNGSNEDQVRDTSTVAEMKAAPMSTEAAKPVGTFLPTATSLPSLAPTHAVASPIAKNEPSASDLLKTIPSAKVVAKNDQPLMRAPHAAPEIVRIDLPNSRVTSREVVRASVFTSSNTASVEARLYGYAMPLQRVGVGHFRLVYQVPDIPMYLKREWPVQVTARNVDGNTATKQVNISVY